MFGADDADWAIYRKIVSIFHDVLHSVHWRTIMVQNASTISSDEEDDFNHLQIIEQKLLAFDPTFTAEHTYSSITTQRSALISAFRPQYGEGDLEGQILVLRSQALI